MAVWNGEHPETGDELVVADVPHPIGAPAHDLPPQPAVFAPDYAFEEIAEIAQKLRKQAGLPDKPTGLVSEESDDLVENLVARTGPSTETGGTLVQAGRASLPLWPRAKAVLGALEDSRFPELKVSGGLFACHIDSVAEEMRDVSLPYELRPARVPGHSGRPFRQTKAREVEWAAITRLVHALSHAVRTTRDPRARAS